MKKFLHAEFKLGPFIIAVFLIMAKPFSAYVSLHMLAWLLAAAGNRAPLPERIASPIKVKWSNKPHQ